MIIAISHSNTNRNNIKTNKITIKNNLENKNWKKNNCKDTSSDNQATKWSWHGWEMNLLISAQNNAKINNTQKKCKCSLFVEKNERVNRRISKCSVLTQKEYKTKVINWKLWKRLKFEHSRQMVYTQTSICPRKWDIWNYLRLTNVFLSPGQKT